MNFIHHIFASGALDIFHHVFHQAFLFPLGGCLNSTKSSNQQSSSEAQSSTAGASSPSVSGSGRVVTGVDAGGDLIEGSKVGGNQVTTYNGLTGSDLVGLVDSLDGNASAAGAAAATPSPIAEPGLVDSFSPGGGGGSGFSFSSLLPWLALLLPGGLVLFFLLRRKTP